jgi:hypothetical protein
MNNKTKPAQDDQLQDITLKAAPLTLHSRKLT